MALANYFYQQQIPHLMRKEEKKKEKESSILHPLGAFCD
jgi:hypothetical protein